MEQSIPAKKIFSVKPLLILGGVFLFVSVASISLLYWVFIQYCNRPLNYKASSSLVFTINPGDSSKVVAQNLYNQGIIPHPLVFMLYLKANPILNIQAGRYQLVEGLSVGSLVALFKKGLFEESIVFIEGQRLEEYALVYARWKCGSSQISCLRYFFDEFVQTAAGLEGYLFPDTYRVSYDNNAKQIINRMLDNFNQKTSDLVFTEDPPKEQVVIFASLVERETRLPEDRSVVAGILLKRWRLNMPLEVDATVQYALASLECADNLYDCSWWPEPENGLKLESPYNTRLYLGLPPGPISNPGLLSLEAVVGAKTSPYLFYFSDSDGTIHYAVTLDEHISNIRKFSN